jgi:hypothetical protein
VTAVSRKAPKTLGGLYNATDSESANSTIRSQIGNTAKQPKERAQEVYTPDSVIELALSVWGEIALDPCWGPGSIVPARKHYYVPPRIEVSPQGKAKTVFTAAPGDQDGLGLAWENFTFVNPPYAHPYLSYWLQKAQAEHMRFGHEIMLLCPVRPHRIWWREALSSCSSIAYLNPVQFIGSESAAPFPLCVFYWGDRLHTFDYCVRALELGATF